jgi:uncharacterized protein YllA (UPF0747 family)
MADKKNSNNFIGFRLSQKFLNKLDLFSEQINKSRGMLAKEALREWINFELLNQTNEMIILSKSLLIELFNSQIETDLKKYAEINSDLIADIMRFSIAEPMNRKNLKEYNKFFTDFFGKKGLKWFNTLDVKKKSDSIILRGLHDLDENFSIFFIHFFKNIIKKHFNLDFKVNTETKSPNLIHLELILV